MRALNPWHMTLLWLALILPSSLLAAAALDDDHLDAGEQRLMSVGPPNFWGCQDDVSKVLPYCDASLSIDDRLQDLLSRLSLEEKVAAISPDPTKDTCTDHTKGVPRIGFPGYVWLVETNTAVASACIQAGKCTTQFSGPLTMGASFNRTAWQLKGSVLGTEQRALMNIGWKRHNRDSIEYIGLNAFGPNINQPRDPRFGRTSELPSEDPFHAGQYATYMVRGMQEPDSAGHPKVLAYLKHFTAYNKETNRGHDDYNITLHDLYDSYLPQFEMAMKQGMATGVMCSYNGVNGMPSCANDYLLNQVLRTKWNRPLAHVTTDCGAVKNLLDAPVHATDEATAAAYALMNGSDVEMGSTVWSDHLVEAVQRDLATTEAVDQAFVRSYRPHFVAGRFDDPATSEWSRFNLDDIQSPLHQQIQLEAALQGLVLLQNKNQVLPISRGSKVAVLGPLAHTRGGLLSDYAEDESCYGGGHDCIPTLAESIQEINGPSATTSAKGVDIDSDDLSGLGEALWLAANADVVVLCLGITKDQEREALDRDDTALPGLQEHLARQVFLVGKPVILVLVNGGQVALDNLVQDPAAIVEAFNPNSVGGKALAMSLFGMENRWGKLPYTIYPYKVMQGFDMEDHGMSTYPGRTYRYFVRDAIFPFGYGLSLTTFEISCSQANSSLKGGSGPLRFKCMVFNTGEFDGDEVVLVYHSAGSDVRESANHPVPIRSLVGFERVRVGAGEASEVEFVFDEDVFELVNEVGEKSVYPGTHKLSFTNGNMKEPIEFRKTIESRPLGRASAVE